MTKLALKVYIDIIIKQTSLSNEEQVNCYLLIFFGRASGKGVCNFAAELDNAVSMLKPLAPVSQDEYWSMYVESH